jgi:hypothetical protein
MVESERMGALLAAATGEQVIAAHLAASYPAREACTELGDWLAALHPRLTLVDHERVPAAARGVRPRLTQAETPAHLTQPAGVSLRVHASTRCPPA